MKLCIAGKNNIAVDICEYALSILDPDDICVITNKSDIGEDHYQKSFLKYARSKKIKQVTLDEIYKYDALCFLSLEFDQLIPVHRFDSSKIYNIHFSLLPKYKGMYTSYWPIMMNEKEAGVTLHHIDSGIDTGAIIAQQAFPISPDETAKSLYYKYIDKGIELVKEWLLRLLNGQVDSIAQPVLNASYYSKKSVDYGKIQIDYNKTAFEINTQVRALRFRDFQMPKFNGNPISHCVYTQMPSKSKPGTLLSETHWFYEIATVDYNLRLMKDRLPYFLEEIESLTLEDLNRYHQYLYSIDDTDCQGKSIKSELIRINKPEFIWWLEQLK